MGTIAAIHEKLVSKQVSCTELTKAYLKEIENANGELNAYVCVTPDEALQTAAAVDKKIAAGEALGLLEGVPMTLKDNMSTKGIDTTCCSKILTGYKPIFDATVWELLKAQNAVMLGKTNMDEFAMGSSTENSGLGVTRNPHDPKRVPGGSSGGSAAAVGGDLCIAALGTDTGGSIRQPASFCGCVGVKPTYGRVSRYGVTAFASSLDQVGPMTKSVDDAAILLKALAGRDRMDGTTPDVPVPDYLKALDGATLKGVRIGLPKEYFAAGMDPEVKRITDGAVAKCAAAGAEIVEVSLPHTEYAMAVYGVRFGHRSAAAKDVYSLYTKSRAEGFGPEVKRRIIMGTYVLSSGYYDAYYGRAQKVRTLVARDFDEAFAKVDALLTPCAPTPAFEFGANQDPLTMYLNDLYTIPSSLAGVCAASVPAGRTDGTRLPVGVQFICGAFEEERLLRVCKAFEDVAC